LHLTSQKRKLVRIAAKLRVLKLECCACVVIERIKSGRDYRALGRPRRRWIDNIKMDLLEIGVNVVDWIGLTQERGGELL
jgi:hypothetical protein